VATAGVTRTFTLTARDAFDNQRDALDDSFVASALLDLEHLPAYASSSTQTAVDARIISQPYVYLLAEGDTHNPPSDPGGKYQGMYTATISGVYNMHVQAVDTVGTGLVAAYFPGSTPDYSQQLTRRDKKIDFNWGIAPPNSNVPPGGSAWSARWLGQVKPLVSGEHTFLVETEGAASLVISGKVVLLAEDTGAPRVWSGTIALAAAVLHDITVDYVHASGPARMHLRWQTAGERLQVVPSAQLFAVKHLVADGVSRLLVRPSFICAAMSHISGNGISVATAGMPTTFGIMTKDEYGNMRDDADDMLIATLVPCDMPSLASLQPISRQMPDTPTSFADATSPISLLPGVRKMAATIYDMSSAIFADHTGNHHSFSYVTTRAGTSVLHAHAAQVVRESSGAVRDIAVVSRGQAYSASALSAALNVTCLPPCVGQGVGVWECARVCMYANTHQSNEEVSPVRQCALSPREFESRIAFTLTPTLQTRIHTHTHTHTRMHTHTHTQTHTQTHTHTPPHGGQ